jgi:hypothetical protein
MQPIYISVPSNGLGTAVSPWQLVDRQRDPIALGFSIVSISTSPLSSGATLQVSFDDPSGQYPNPLSSPSPGVGAPSSNPFVTAFNSSAIGGSPAGNPSAGFISGPIAAWRVANLSTAGTALASVLQGGPR